MVVHVVCHDYEVCDYEDLYICATSLVQEPIMANLCVCVLLILLVMTEFRDCKVARDSNHFYNPTYSIIIAYSNSCSVSLVGRA